MEASSYSPPPKLTVEDYFKFEETSDVRHEFRDGQVYAMAGGTVNHNVLVDNVKDGLKAGIKGRGCRVFSENMKVEAVRGVYMPYPDVVVACHPFDLRGDNLIIRQPRMLVEVLSKSTAYNDRGFKWQRYRRMPSLWYYLLVDQYKMAVELFSRIEQTDEWINTVYEQPEDVIVMPRLDLELTLAAIYDGINLIPDEEESRLEGLE
ncbi:MAG: Uma2 family endonuclease [Rudanella sp.]|nr:Uma2 family endonuclease [Rudanella sp.]